MIVFPTPALSSIDQVIQTGRGVAASVIGQTYNVYRLSGTSTGQQVQAGNLVITGFPCSMERVQSVGDTESNYFSKVPIFKGTCNARQYLQIGDILVETGYEEDGSVFTYCYSRPLHRNIFMWTPIPLTITHAENNPLGVVSGEVPYPGMMKNYEQFLVLNNGLYSWASTGTPTTVYAGLVVESPRPGELPPPVARIATDVARQRYSVAHGLLPGVQLVESDIYNAADGDRYYCRLPYLQYVGLIGYQNAADKLRV